MGNDISIYKLQYNNNILKNRSKNLKKENHIYSLKNIEIIHSCPNKNHILSDIKLYLNVNNKIIIKNDIINSLILLYNNANKNSLKYLLMILNYLWLYRNDKLFEKIKNELKYTNEGEKTIIDSIQNNYALNLSRIIEYILDNRIKIISMNLFCKNLKYISELKVLDISSIVNKFIDDWIDNKEIELLCKNIKYISNLLKLNISCIFNI